MPPMPPMPFGQVRRADFHMVSPPVLVCLLNCHPCPPYAPHAPYAHRQSSLFKVLKTRCMQATMCHSVPFWPHKFNIARVTQMTMSIGGIGGIWSKKPKQQAEGVAKTKDSRAGGGENRRAMTRGIGGIGDRGIGAAGWRNQRVVGRAVARTGYSSDHLPAPSRAATPQAVAPPPSAELINGPGCRATSPVAMIRHDQLRRDREGGPDHEGGQRREVPRDGPSQSWPLLPRDLPQGQRRLPVHQIPLGRGPPILSGRTKGRWLTN